MLSSKDDEMFNLGLVAADNLTDKKALQDLLNHLYKLINTSLDRSEKLIDLINSITKKVFF